jgi:hypothetical protein
MSIGRLHAAGLLLAQETKDARRSVRFSLSQAGKKSLRLGSKTWIALVVPVWIRSDVARTAGKYCQQSTVKHYCRPW